MQQNGDQPKRFPILVPSDALSETTILLSYKVYLLFVMFI